MIETAERWRTRFCFVLFAMVFLAVFSRLVYLQGARSRPNLAAVRQARNLVDPMPFPRGAILDRHGEPIAYDRPVLRVRAEFQARVPKGARRIPRADIEGLARRLASHLAAGDPDASRADLEASLTRRMLAARHKPMPTKSRRYDYLLANFLVAPDLDSYESTRRLHEEVELWKSKKQPGRLHLRFAKTYQRTYPARDATRGVVGNYWVGEREVEGENGEKRTQRYEAATGAEACKVVWAPPPRVQRQLAAGRIEFKDARRRRFWTGLGRDPEAPSRLQTTLDLELQQLAHAELRGAVELLKDKHFDWGAMVLIEIPSGDVLAMASHYPGAKGPKPFAPIENAFEPGSVVKPLVVAYALESGAIGWDDTFDCTPTLPDHGRPVAGFSRRVIKDDHRCEVLTPHGIIQNSSNIGAVQIGVKLQPSGMQSYMRAYGLCERTGLPLKGEARGMGPGMTYARRKRGVKGLHLLNAREFGQNTGPSISFGYEHNVTTVQLARAYLRLLTGQRRDLRFVQHVDKNGRRYEPEAQKPERFLSDDTVRKVHEAMTAVVTDEPGEHATGRNLHRLIADLGHEQPLIAGKTGTADSPIRTEQGTVRAKTAAFVGYAPVAAPRYLAVCVLRKDGASKFYGGSYAAPPVGRLLLGALASKQTVRAPLRQVRAWTGVRGSSSDK